MELKYSALSPYVRKVLVVAHELGIAHRIRLAPVNTAQNPEQIVPFNPLGKIPALITDSGAVIHDSPVICEFLDAEYGNHRLLPAGGQRRWEGMTFVALADGVVDAAILLRHERARPPELQSADWRTRQITKVNNGFDRLEAMAANFGDTLEMGHIATGCALGYIEVRLEDYKGYAKWPRLKDWFARISQRPSFQATAPKM